MAIYVTKKTTVRENPKTAAEIQSTVLELAKDASAENVLDITVQLGQALYTLDKPLVFSVKENPALAFVNLTVRAEGSMRPSLTSLVKIPAEEFVPVEGKPYFKYQFPKGEDGSYPRFHDLYLNASRIFPSKSPIFRNKFLLLPEERKGEVKKEGLYVPYEMAETLATEALSGAELNMYVEWESSTMRVKGVDLTKTKEEDGVKYALVTMHEEFDLFVTRTNGCLNIGNRETFFTNALAYLTEPNTYVYDCQNGLLYFIPEVREHMKWANLSYPTLENLLMADGLKNFTLEGITFTGATSKYICDNGFCCGQANTEWRMGRVRHAAVVTSNMRNVTIRDCTFKGLGGNGVLMCDQTAKANIYDNRFEDIGMTALSIGNPTTAWEKPENRNFSISVINNYFNRIAYEYPTAVCLYVGIVDGLKIMHNTMNNTAYSAISVGWGWSRVGYELGEKVNIRDAEIAYNKFHNFMDVLRDGAAIYVLGANCTENHGGQFNFMHDNYATLDDRRDVSKRGYYMDGSSSNWEVWNNVIDNCALPVFSQFHVPSQFTHHNYIHDVYSTTVIDEGNHAPWRDTILGECFVETEGLEALMAKYPEVVCIRDCAGCSLDL